MSDAPRNNFQPQGIGPSPLGVSKPLHSEVSRSTKPSAIKSLSKMGFRMWLGMFLLVVLTVGGAAAAYLSTVSQDLRQQASGDVKKQYLIVGVSGTPAPTPRLGVGADCTQVSKNATGNYCADARLGNCLKCGPDGKAVEASDAACNGLPCGANVQLTQAAGSKCSGNVTQGTVACADSEQVAPVDGRGGNCRKCEYDKDRGYAVYKEVDPSECYSQSLICGVPKPPTSTPRPVVSVSPVTSVSPVGSVSVSPGVSGAPTLTKIPTATKVPTVTPNLFAGVTGVGVGGSGCSPSNKCQSGYYCDYPTIWDFSGGTCKQNFTGFTPTPKPTVKPVATLAPTKTAAQVGVTGVIVRMSPTAGSGTQCNPQTFRAACNGDVSISCNNGFIKGKVCSFGCDSGSGQCKNQLTFPSTAVIPTRNPSSTLIVTRSPNGITVPQSPAPTRVLNSVPSIVPCGFWTTCPAGTSCSALFTGACKPNTGGVTNPAPTSAAEQAGANGPIVRPPTPTPKPDYCALGRGCSPGYSCSGWVGTCQLNITGGIGVNVPTGAGGTTVANITPTGPYGTSGTGTSSDGAPAALKPTDGAVRPANVTPTQILPGAPKPPLADANSTWGDPDNRCSYNTFSYCDNESLVSCSINKTWSKSICPNRYCMETAWFVPFTTAVCW